MKKTITVFMCLAMPFLMMAQEKTKQQEVGLVFNDLNNFGISYKFGDESVLTRLTLLTTSGSVSTRKQTMPNHEEGKSNHFGITFRGGEERRKPIAEKLEFRYGLDLMLSFSSTKEENNQGNIDHLRWRSFTPGVNFVLGFNYLISDQIILGAEIAPYVQYSITNRTYTDNNEDQEIKEKSTSFNYGLSSQSVFVTLAYRF